MRQAAVGFTFMWIVACPAIPRTQAQVAPEEPGYPVSRDELIEMARLDLKTNKSIPIVFPKHIVGEDQFDLMAHQSPKSPPGMPPFKSHYFFMVQDGAFPLVLGSTEVSGESMILSPRSAERIPGIFLPPLNFREGTSCTLIMTREPMNWPEYLARLCEGSVEWVEQPIDWEQMDAAMKAQILVLKNPEDLPASKFANGDLVGMQSRAWERPIRGEDGAALTMTIPPTCIRWDEDEYSEFRLCVVPLGAEGGELFLMRAAYLYGDLMPIYGYRINSPSRPIWGENLFLRFPLGESTFFALTKRIDLHKADIARGEWSTGWSLSGPFQARTDGLCAPKDFHIDLSANARPVSPQIVRAIEEEGTIDLRVIESLADAEVPETGSSPPP
jgi:hypothetical protein